MRHDDGWPTEPVLASTLRLALREEALPGHLPPASVRLHREVRRRMRELDLVLDHCPDPGTAAELRGATTSLHELLASHFPLGSRHCPTCRGRLGRHRPWPCHVWRTTYAVLVPMR